MTLRPILKAMPRYRRAQRSSASSSYACSSNSPPSTGPSSPDPVPLTSVSPPSPPSSGSPSPSTSSPRALRLSSLPSPRLRSPLMSPHVHFPPTPAISSTQLTHSSSTYDRAPIQVSPNSCELPERGGRVYEIGSPDSVCHAPRTNLSPGSYFHPNAFEACEAEEEEPSPMFYSGSSCGASPSSSSQHLQIPPLVHDLLSSGSSSSCSESEDSDLSPNPYINSFDSSPLSPDAPPSNQYFGQYSPYHSYPLSNPLAQEELAHALSFLPYSPVHRKETRIVDDASPAMHKARKRHSKKTLRGDQTPRLSRRCSEIDWESTQLDGCLGGF
ncbi:hypothetical protein VKT23_004885 [Stygiomarasmius scandens]|uniref:Uncharacterized protein n=1 Tax=Marasmiellus scandens TaxID=2682957 RepID=A0ABR1JUD7_9AGAR